ncbi:transcription factor domain-containing protein [Aspergillus clavatus NRRL 1]|uniref:Fungal specific transcription factor domain protein n=1 Tax=Aspergillus clavatus (strain ATCC 1007 / CBS 513.65 / DSM 816 / NCTC 3887 / NRRL 1 / QM 1276 / 107) TaxID=344612 RepID=A1CLG2_ASPCL|nr:fungal specific transcription factor domain protein [Aspergillus clavatus NRRL 1]EAW09986.1 fungal specific transcription factor domain protein [Aspergillus clavatus NRRL 1]
MDSESPKRGAGSPDPPRSKKRAKYTQVACNECKRRKLKCSGERVCVRCARDNVSCVYVPNAHSFTLRTPTSPEAQQRDDGLSSRLSTVDHQIETLQREMRAMASRLRQLESASPAMARNTPTAVSTGSSISMNAGLHRIMNRPQSPSFVGPTSAEFGLTARQRASEEMDGDSGDDLVSIVVQSPAPAPEEQISPDDPLGGLGRAEALRLVTVYENMVGLMYPCVDLDSVRGYIADFFRHKDQPGPSPLATTDQDWFFARDVEVLKILLATALLVESHGRSERAALLADSVEGQFATRVNIPEVDMKELLILTLLSIFHSYRDDEVISWRLIGMAVRGSMQLGLHCQETWQKTGGVFPGELQCEWASRLFWCIYVLDRKWSFGTGLPFAIQDSDMDTNLPEPGTATPYLTCMINYARLSTKIWGLVVGWRSRPRAATADYCSYLDFQVQQWIQSIPPELRFDLPQHPSDPAHSQPDSMMMLQVLLALQANQLRILVYRQNLLSSESIEANVPGASTAVETAKSTVHMLDYFSRVSDLYFQRPEPFNYFLISALAALFLAVLHAPGRFSQVVRPEFYAAVDMVRRSSTRARTSRRLQKIIRSLKMIWMNLGARSPRPCRQGQHGQRPLHEQQQKSGGSRHAGTAGLSVAGSSRSPYAQRGVSGIPTPQLSASASASAPASAHFRIATTAAAGPIDDTSCEDLTSFFEMAGGFYFDSRMGNGVTTHNEGLVPEAGVEGFDAFQAEDEALTRVMAGLL